MSVDGFLDRANSNLERAIKAKTREISDLRADIIRGEKDAHKEVDKLERKILSQEADVVLLNLGPGETAHDFIEIKQMKEQIKEVQREFDDFKRNTEQKIKEAERLLQDIKTKASDIKSMSG